MTRPDVFDLWPPRSNVIPLHRGAVEQSGVVELPLYRMADEHRIPAAQRRIADDYQRRCEQLDEQSRDYAGPRFVRAEPRPPAFGEKLVLFMRLNGALCVGICIGIGLGCLLTAALAYAVRWTVLS